MFCTVVYSIVYYQEFFVCFITVITVLFAKTRRDDVWCEIGGESGDCDGSEGEV